MSVAHILSRNAIALWLRYQVETELFDRRLPGAFSPHDPDVWIPAAGEPFARSARFARDMRSRVLERAARLGIPLRDLDEAQRDVARLPFAQQLREYNALAADGVYVEIERDL